MSRGSVLARGRGAAERSMIDACVVDRSTGQATDLETGEVVDTWEPVYTGRCRVQQRPAQAQEDVVAEQAVLMLTWELQLPVLTSTAVRAGHRVRLTAATDPALLDRHWFVKGEHAKTEATARRLVMEEAT